MRKEDIKSLITNIYNELIENIDAQDAVTKGQLVNYFQDATNTIASIKSEDPADLKKIESAFTNSYKDLVKTSINSYQSTNGRFEELTKVHKETLDFYNDSLIEIPQVGEKFSKIQADMHKEVENTNLVIKELTDKIRALEKSSNVDSLTKIFNRRALNTYLSNLCYKTKNPPEMHLLMLDLDDFKNINDTYGHIAGDKILIFVANILKQNLREDDRIFRYGGEEFIIVLNKINPELCMDISQKILKLISANKLIYKGEGIHVTTSIGSTRYFAGDTPETLIARADKALYRSKNNGKNQINSEL